MGRRGKPRLLIMNTAEVKKLLFEAMEKPTKKRMKELAVGVVTICDILDSQDTLGAVIRAGNESLEHSFSMLQALMDNQRKQ